VEPFVKHCGLARLPGQPPFGGEILSHDFVEAALMGRAGWEVWLAWGLAGSYEESPPSLLDELKRDRRWCQGNLQHLRFFPGDRIRTGHRAIFCIGFLAYASALLWFSFLILNTIELVTQSLITPIYFSSHPSLFPIWPAWHPEWAIALLSTTALLLFLPKILSLVLILKNREAPLYGGLFSLSVSMLLETVLSTLLAPVRMWFHSKFVLATLAGKPIKWNAQCRTGHATGWLEAIRAHGISTLFAFGWMIAVFWVDPVLTVWLMPVAVSLLLSIPLSVYTSRIGSGRAAGRWLLRIPEESVVPPVIETLREILEKREHEKFVDDGWAITPARPLSEGMRQEVRFSRTVEAGETQERNRDLQEAAPGPL
jgi:membrane glycosyltransferase